MNKRIIFGLVVAVMACKTSTMSHAEELPKSKMSECAAKWRETKAAEGFKAEKGQYRAHMTVCLRKSSGPVTR